MFAHDKVSTKKERFSPLLIVAPLARLEHATFWSATKRSNPLSYRSIGGRDCNAGGGLGQVCLTLPIRHGRILALRESPSGKASAFQADIRGFESRLPLCYSAGSRQNHGGWNQGPMAQWLAQATHNRLVVGSNPTGPTNLLQSGGES